MAKPAAPQPLSNPTDYKNMQSKNNPLAFNNPASRLAWQQYQLARQSSYGQGQEQEPTNG